MPQVLIVSAINETGYRKGDAFLGYDNLLLRSDVSIAASDELTGSPASNAASWPTYAKWRLSASGTVIFSFSFPEAQAIRALGIHRHNLGSNGATVRLRYSDDASTFTTLIDFNPGPEDLTAFRIASAAETHKFWRVEIDNPNAASLYIGNIFAGDPLQLVRPPEPSWSPPPLSRTDAIQNSRSEGGDFLGRTVRRRGSTIDVRLTVLDEGWVRTYWEPFYAAIFDHPFLLSWDAARYPDDAAFCYTPDTPQAPAYTNGRHLTVGFQAIALRN